MTTFAALLGTPLFLVTARYYNHVVSTEFKSFPAFRAAPNSKFHPARLVNTLVLSTLNFSILFFLVRFPLGFLGRIPVQPLRCFSALEFTNNTTRETPFKVEQNLFSVQEHW